MPPIYPTVPGQYVYPTPSSEVGATVYVNKALDLVVADGVTLTANTVGNHYFSIGAQVTLAGTAYVIFDLDGTYTITGIPTANSFTCSTTLAGISYNGTVSSPGIQCGDIISYFSTTNSNLWVNNVTNKTWQITGGTNVGNVWTFTTSAPSNLPVGSQVVLNLPNMGYVNYTTNTTASSETTFSCIINKISVAGSYLGGHIFSEDDGKTWNYCSTQLIASWNSISYADNGTVVAVGVDFLVRVNIGGQGRLAYSNDSGKTWTYTNYQPLGLWTGVAYGNGTFVMCGVHAPWAFSPNYPQAYSLDYGKTWTFVDIPSFNAWNSVAFGNNTFVLVGASGGGAYSTDNGLTWTLSTTGLYAWSVTFGNGVFVTVGNNNQAYSIDNGQTWTLVSHPLSGGGWYGVAFGNNTFVMVGDLGQAYSTDNGQTWTLVSSPLMANWYGITFGTDTFMIVGDLGQAYSIDNGHTWTFVSEPFTGIWSCIASQRNLNYSDSPSNSVSLIVPPLQLLNRTFSSNVYPSISFANAADAAFWGFESREGLTYTFPATPPWTYTQSGWISGFLPPSTSTYDDSVAHKLCKEVRLLVGKQTIKEYSGEYIELQNDLLVPYENKAILKLMNGTLDQTQATVAREYYVNLPLGTKEVPLCALTHQNMSVEVDFDSYMNVSQNLNAGTGDFLDAKSYTTYDASTGLLGGQPVNVQTTFSYQQYIFIVTYGGQFLIFDTTKNVDDPASYIVLSAFSGSNLFKQFCVLSGNLYIGLADGQLLRGIITELIQGNTSSLEINSYTPTIGSLTGTMIADFRYVYYTVSNTASSNVFMTKYDTTGTFTSTSSYRTVDFTLNFNSNVTGVYQTLTTGTELVLLPQGTPGKLYTYQLNANVQSQWYVLDYSSYGTQITEGVLVKDSIYFICDPIGILKYSNSNFDVYVYGDVFVTTSIFTAKYSLDNGKTWHISSSSILAYPDSWGEPIYANETLFVMSVLGKFAYSTDSGFTWHVKQTNFIDSIVAPKLAFGNDTLVAVGDSGQVYSNDNGQTWNYASSPLPGPWYDVAFGNDTFVMIGYNTSLIAYSADNGRTWQYSDTQLPINWRAVGFGNDTFVVFGGEYGYYSNYAYSTDNGRTWTLSVSTLYIGTAGNIIFENNIFVIAGQFNLAYSNDGKTWTESTTPIVGGVGLAFGNGIFLLSGVDEYGVFKEAFSNDGKTWIDMHPSELIAYLTAATTFHISGGVLKNLIAVGTSIYASTNNVAVRIDTTKDLSTAAAYSFPAPLPTNQYVFANGPRYVYMFAQGDNTAKNIVEYDPYGPDQTFKASILVDYESLPKGTKKPDKALLGLIQTQKVTDMTQMNIKGPVKELWVTGASDSANVFQYSNLATQSTLELANEPIVTEDVGTRTFLSTIQPFETHTSMPIRNFSVVPFEFDPESPVPNGTVNFSRIRDQIFDGDAETVWARSYNLLAIQGGIGNLMYN
jgi:hypothetical protein